MKSENSNEVLKTVNKMLNKILSTMIISLFQDMFGSKWIAIISQELTPAKKKAFLDADSDEKRSNMLDCNACVKALKEYPGVAVPFDQNAKMKNMSKKHILDLANRFTAESSKIKKQEINDKAVMNYIRVAIELCEGIGCNADDIEALKKTYNALREKERDMRQTEARRLAELNDNDLLKEIPKGKLREHLNSIIPTHSTYDLLFRHERHTLEVYQVPIRCLEPNRYNGRIADVRREADAQAGTANAWDEGDHETVDRQLLEALSDNSIRDLAESIYTSGQLEPAVVTPDGVILSGNRRWAAHAILERRNQQDGFNYPERMLCVIVTREMANDEKGKKLLEIQLQMNRMEKQDYSMYNKCLDVYNAVKTIGVPVKEYAEHAGTKNIAEIQRKVWAVEMETQFCERLNLPKGVPIGKSDMTFLTEASAMYHNTKDYDEDEREAIFDMCFCIFVMHVQTMPRELIRSIKKYTKTPEDREACKQYFRRLLNEQSDYSKILLSKAAGIDFSSQENLNAFRENNQELSKNIRNSIKTFTGACEWRQKSRVKDSFTKLEDTAKEIDWDAVSIAEQDTKEFVCKRAEQLANYLLNQVASISGT